MTSRVAALGLVLLLAAPVLGSREGAFIGYTELKGETTRGSMHSLCPQMRSDRPDVACAGKKVVLTTSFGKVHNLLASL